MFFCCLCSKYQKMHINAFISSGLAGLLPLQPFPFQKIPIKVGELDENSFKLVLTIGKMLSYLPCRWLHIVKVKNKNTEKLMEWFFPKSTIKAIEWPQKTFLYWQFRTHSVHCSSVFIVKLNIQKGTRCPKLNLDCLLFLNLTSSRFNKLINFSSLPISSSSHKTSSIPKAPCTLEVMLMTISN